MIKQTDTRPEQILTLLLKSPAGMSIDQLAAELDISRNALKQHLLGLENQNLVQSAGLNSTGGRPARSYILTEQGIHRFPKQYAWFCNLLLSELAGELSSAALEKMFWKMGVESPFHLARCLKRSICWVVAAASLWPSTPAASISVAGP